jgi:hypothetical protein
MHHKIMVRSERESHKQNCKVLGSQAPNPCNLKCLRIRKTDSRSIAWRHVHGRLDYFDAEHKDAIDRAEVAEEQARSFAYRIQQLQQQLEDQGRNVDDQLELPAALERSR